MVISEPDSDPVEEMVHLPDRGLTPRSKISNHDISNMIVKCTVCSKQVFHHTRGVRRHPHLDVLICKDCAEFYGDGNFSQDELGDKYCRWCAQGGKLNVCDYCTNAFCNECIRRNLGRSEVGRIKGIKWHCYVCTSKPLSGLVSFCKMIVKYNKSSPLSVREKAASASHKNSSNAKKKTPKKRPAINGQPTDAPSDDGDVSSDNSSAAKCWLNSHCERTLHYVSRVCRKTKKLQFKATDEMESPQKVLQMADKLEKLLLKHQRHVKALLIALASDKELKSKDNDGVMESEASQSLLAGLNAKVKPSVPVKTLVSTGTQKEKRKAPEDAGSSKKSISRRLSLSSKDETSSPNSSTSRAEKSKPEPSTSKSVASKVEDSGPEPLIAEDDNVVSSSVPVEEALSSKGSIASLPLDNSEENANKVKMERLSEPSVEGDGLDLSADDVNMLNELSLQGVGENLSDIGTENGHQLDDAKSVVDDSKSVITVNDIDDSSSDDSNSASKRKSGKGSKSKFVGQDSAAQTGIDNEAGLSETNLESTAGLSETNLDSTAGLNETNQDSTAEMNETSLLDTTVELDKTSLLESTVELKKTVINSDKESEELKKVDEEVLEETAEVVENVKRSSDDDTTTKLLSTDTMETVENKSDKATSSDRKPKGVKAKEEPLDNSGAKELLLKEYLESSDSDAAEEKKPIAKIEKKKSSEASSDEHSSSSLEDFDLDFEKSRKKKKLMAKKTKKEDEEDKKVEEVGKEAFRLSQDDKIQGHISVVLEKLGPSDVESYLTGSMPLPEAKSAKKEDDLEKEIDRLEKMPKISKSSEGSKSKKKKASPQKPPIKRSPARAILSTSDSTSSSDSDSDLSENSLDSSPQVKPIKGESINEAAKQALLMEDTSSSSSDGLGTSSEEEKKGKKRPSRASKEDDEEAAVDDGSSSDFEGGSRKKKKTDKLLRFPINGRGEKGKGKKSGNKEEDNSKTKKRKKRFVTDSDESGKNKDSDSSVQSVSSSEEFQASKPSKKRRRIKTVRDSSSEEGDKSKKEENVPDTPSGKGRKNIRKVLDKEDLAAETRKATQAERERRKRIQERQKMFNQVSDFMEELGHHVTRKLVLDVDQSSKEILIEVDQDLVTKLKPHQVDGVKFMFLATVESVQQLKEGKHGSGCILAHCMGLGKTLQVITYIHTLLTNENTKPYLKTCLVVSPYNTVLNWATEFGTWQDGLEDQVELHELTNIKSNQLRADVLKHWQKMGGVLIIGYDKFRLLTNEKAKSIPKKLKAVFAESLLDPGPDIVVCDEGHILKNEKSAISKAMTQIRTKRRIVLTGTPLQNNLQEYHCMVQFVKPHLLGQRKEFQNRFLNPITNGQCADSTPQDVKLMKKRVHILHTLLEGCVQRCDYNAVTIFLPPKYEYVISVRLSEPQIKIYRHYLENMSSRGGVTSGSKGTSLFKDFNMLKLIWTHPYVLQLCKIRQDLKYNDEDDEDSIAEFIDDGSASGTWSSSASDNEVTCLDDPKPSTSTGAGDDEVEVVNKWKTRTRGGKKKEENEEEEEVIEKEVVEKSWWNEYVPVEDQMKLELGGKMVLLFEILKQCEAVGDKILVFTSSLLTLDMIEELLAIEDNKNEEAIRVERERKKEEERKKAEEAARKEDGTTDQAASGEAAGKSEEKKEPVAEKDPALEDRIGTWVQGIDYFRMDGTTSAEIRKRCTEKFNNTDNERARLYLISTKAGSLGINLVGANRVIVMDASWNPTHDVQAIFRVFRFGQKKPVYIYRFLAQGTMEEKIYDRQVAKQSLACRVVDEQQIERHFNAADLAELYSFEPDSKTKRPTPLVPKDLLLAELLMTQKEWIVSYHEHDSLLRKDNEGDLTEEERKVAWAEYEAEKEGRSLYQEQNNVPLTSLLQGVLQGDMFNQNFDIKQMADELRRKNPHMTPREIQHQLVLVITALLRHHQNRYHKIYQDIQQISMRKELIPNELKTQLGESYRMVHNLNQLQNVLRMQANPQMNQRPGVVPRHQNRPQFNPQQHQGPRIATSNYRQQFISQNRPVLYSRNLPPRGIYQDNLGNIVTALKNRNVTTEPINKPQGTSSVHEPSVIITEMDENTPSPVGANGASSATSTSTVVITELD